MPGQHAATAAGGANYVVPPIYVEKVDLGKVWVRRPMNIRHKDATQAGATLVELLLVLPIFILILAGIFEFGVALRNIESISEAAKHGSRSGAALSLQNLPSAAPLYPCRPVDSCGEDGPDCGNAMNEATLECLATRETERYLRAMGEPTEAWTVSSAVCSAGEFTVLRVRVDRTPGSESCILCLHDWIGRQAETASSIHLLEGAC